MTLLREVGDGLEGLVADGVEDLLGDAGVAAQVGELGENLMEHGGGVIIVMGVDVGSHIYMLEGEISSVHAMRAKCDGDSSSSSIV